MSPKNTPKYDHLKLWFNFYKDFCKYIRKTTKVIRYHNRRVYCGLEYIRQVIDGTIKVDEEFREILLSMFQWYVCWGGHSASLSSITIISLSPVPSKSKTNPRQWWYDQEDLFPYTSEPFWLLSWHRRLCWLRWRFFRRSDWSVWMKKYMRMR